MKPLILSMLISSAAFGTQCVTIDSNTFCDDNTTIVRVGDFSFIEDNSDLQKRFLKLSKAEQKKVLQAIQEELENE